MNHRKEVSGEFVIMDGDPAEGLTLAEEPRNQIPPWGTGSKNPEDAVQHALIVDARFDTLHYRISSMFYYYLISPGERPQSTSVANHLWGNDCDFDSDGNDDEAPLGGWTELTVSLRPECEERVDIDPIDNNEPLVLVIRSQSTNLAKKAALFLQSHSGGELSKQAPR